MIKIVQGIGKFNNNNFKLNNNYSKIIIDSGQNGLLKISNQSENSIKSLIINGKEQILPTSIGPDSQDSYNLNNGINNIEIKGDFNIKNTVENIKSVQLNNITTMANMFENCSGLIDINLNSSDLTKVTNMNSCFKNCTNLKTIDNKLINYIFNKPERLIDTTDCYNNCTKLSFDYKDGFEYDSLLYVEERDLPNKININFIPESFGGKGYKKLIARYDFDKSINDHIIYLGVNSYKILDVKTNGNIVTREIYSEELPTAIYSQAFGGLIHVEYINTSNMTKFSGAFFLNTNLKTINLQRFNFKNMTKMDGIFSNCTSLISVDFSGKITNKVTTLTNLFSNCKNLEYVNLSNCDTSNVTNFYSLFGGCTKIKLIDISSFDTSKGEKLGMFSSCESLEYVNMSKLTTESMTNISQMFENCSKLKVLYLTNFDTSKVVEDIERNDNGVVVNWTQRTFKNVKCPIYVSKDKWTLTESFVGYTGGKFIKV